VPDYSEVEELQADKKSKAGWVSTMYQDGVINGNEYRELMEQEPVNDRHHETYYINMNKIPADRAYESDILGPDSDEEKAYMEMGINY